MPLKNPSIQQKLSKLFVSSKIGGKGSIRRKKKNKRVHSEEETLNNIAERFELEEINEKIEIICIGKDNKIDSFEVEGIKNSKDFGIIAFKGKEISKGIEDVVKMLSEGFKNEKINENENENKECVEKCCEEEERIEE